ncbi:MAG TPA: hypothetical protein PLP19_20765 [bacterium]|nr:hypothetical protein [bacterium]HPN45928.1 hypothetical protein [bacterium]
MNNLKIPAAPESCSNQARHQPGLLVRVWKRFDKRADIYPCLL